MICYFLIFKDHSTESTEHSKKIYLINDGQISLSLGHLDNRVAILGTGEMFGLFSILDCENTKERALSMGFSSVYTISQHDFLCILKENVIDYVIF